MEQDLEKILDELLEIQVSLRKLGPIRRLQYIRHVKERILKAEELYSSYKIIISVLLKKKCSSELTQCISVLKEKIEVTYNKILSYSIISEESNISLNMEKFDIKTATSLIPIMDGSEETTENIIDTIELYNDSLKDRDQAKMLISFVLKTRLTKTAKLKLKSEYDDIPSLVQDIKTYLITKKSANSILCQLNNLSQNNLSINEYGNKLSELFIGLTIAQADGNEKACEILRPINEKLAIKKFSDGLRNRRLSTIISARNYSQLKDAVRAAEDEELTQPSSSNAIFNARGKSNNRINNYYNNRGGGNNFYNKDFYRRNNYPTGQNNNYNQQRFLGSFRGNMRNFRGNMRGRGKHYPSYMNNNYNTPKFRGGSFLSRTPHNNRRMLPIQVCENSGTTSEKTLDGNQFFRT